MCHIEIQLNIVSLGGMQYQLWLAIVRGFWVFTAFLTVSKQGYTEIRNHKIAM